MEKLIVKSLRMKGFKNHKEEMNIVLGESFNTIVGDNGTGKTAIGEAITWAFLGSNLTGNEKADSSLMNGSTTEVEVNFSFNGVEHNLLRKRKKSTEIFLDGQKITNFELREFTTDKDTFLSIFNPEYFVSKTPKDAKDYLTKILGDIEDEEVFKMLGDYMKEILLSNGFKYPNRFLEEKREEIKTLEEDVLFLEGYIAGRENQEEEKLELKVYDVEVVNALKESLTDLRKQRPVSPYNIVELREKKESYEKEIIRLEYSTAKLKDTLAVEKEINRIEEALKYGLNKEKIDLIDLTPLEGKQDSLRREYKALKSKLSNESIKCPKCETEIELKAEYNKEIKAQLNEVKLKGLNAGKEIEEAKKENQRRREEFVKAKDQRLEVMKEELSKAKEKLEQIVKENEWIVKKDKAEREKKVAELNTKIKNLNIIALEEKNKEFEEKFYKDLEEEISKLEEKIAEEEKVIEEVKLHNMEVKRQEGNKFVVEEKKRDLENNKAKIEDIKTQISICKNFITTKLELQTEMINKHLNKVSIKLQEMVKSTGELKDTFKITYDGKDFNVLSNSERKKAGLEIANLIMNVLDLRYPIFLDDAESITRYDRLDTQMIEARVLENSLLKIS